MITLYITQYSFDDALPLISTGELSLHSCKKWAFDDGFVWVMLLLARERDARESYLDIKHYWDSYDDLTGDIILFLFSSGGQSYLREEDYISAPFTGTGDACSSLYEIALRNQTSSVSKLCAELGIGEDKIPAIVLLPTDPSKHYSIVLSIENDDLYSTIKSMMDNISFQVKVYRAKRSEIQSLEIQRKILRQQLDDYRLSSTEKRFIEAFNYIQDYMTSTASDREREALIDCIQRQSLHHLHGYPRLLRKYLNQYIDLMRTNRSLIDCSDKLADKQKKFAILSTEIERLCDSIAFARHSLSSARHLLEDCVVSYCESKQTYVRTNFDFPVHVKISFSFSGKYLERVRLICECLLRLGYSKEEVFFYPWHEDIVNGVDSDRILADLYSNQSEFIVVLLSEDYMEKNWTKGVEWRAIKELVYSGKGRNICLLKTGRVPLQGFYGLHPTQAITQSIDGISPEQTAKFIDSFIRRRS